MGPGGNPDLDADDPDGDEPLEDPLDHVGHKHDADFVTGMQSVDPVRSALMARVKSTNSSPERSVRKALHRLGYRFRLHDRRLPGTPDIVLPSRKIVIFVHGCLWHRHAGCRACTTPRTRREFWENKFAANVARDAQKEDALRRAGWLPFTIRECEVKTGCYLSDTLEFINGHPP